MGRWRIYYDDGSTYTGDPFEAPGRGVQVIVRENTRSARGFGLMHGRDFYWWRDEAWCAGEIFGLWEYLSTPGPKRVLFGRSMASDDEFFEIVARAGRDRLE